MFFNALVGTASLDNHATISFVTGGAVAHSHATNIITKFRKNIAAIIGFNSNNSNN